MARSQQAVPCAKDLGEEGPQNDMTQTLLGHQEFRPSPLPPQDLTGVSQS